MFMIYLYVDLIIWFIKQTLLCSKTRRAMFERGLKMLSTSGAGGLTSFI